MKIGAITQLSPQILIHYARNQEKDYGEKYLLFSMLVHNKFDKIIKINFDEKLEKGSLSFAIMAGIIVKKIIRLEDEDYSALQFLNDIKYKSAQILTASSSSHRLIEQTPQKFFNLITMALNEQAILIRINEDNIYLYMYALVNMACNHKQTKYTQIDHYKEEQMGKISKVLKENVYLINYDIYNKESLYNLNISHGSVYILKAKEMFFILLKDPDISIIDKGIISNQELAAIFNREQKLVVKKEQPLKKQMSNIQENQNCVICFAHKKQWMNTSCFHLCVCEQCAPKMKNTCPICRAEGVFKKVFL